MDMNYILAGSKVLLNDLQFFHTLVFFLMVKHQLYRLNLGTWCQNVRDVRESLAIYCLQQRVLGQTPGGVIGA